MGSSRRSGRSSRSELESEIQEATESKDWERVRELSEALSSGRTGSTRRKSSGRRSGGGDDEINDDDDYQLPKSRSRRSRSRARRYSDDSSSSDDDWNPGKSLLGGLFAGLGVAAGASAFNALTPSYEYTTYHRPVMRRTVYRPVDTYWI